jgi:hypothetical protein
MHRTGPAVWFPSVERGSVPARPVIGTTLFDTGTMQRDLEFTFEGKPVGYFEESECPRVPGRYRYMPYRGIGHYELGVRRVGFIPTGSAPARRAVGMNPTLRD